MDRDTSVTSLLCLHYCGQFYTLGEMP